MAIRLSTRFFIHFRSPRQRQFCYSLNLIEERLNIIQKSSRPILSHWREALLRREILAICLFIFITDMILGSMRPILSLFATRLGASLTLVGTLSLVVGLTQLTSGVLIGIVSDRQGRKGVLMTGMLFLGLTALLMALTTNPYLLLPVQVLLGLGFVSTITVGLAYTADLVTTQDRSVTFGLVTTMMGIGYAVGAAIGGTVAEINGYSATYVLAAATAVIGFFMTWAWIPGRQSGIGLTTRRIVPLSQQMRAMIANPVILTVCIGGLLIHLMFGGVIVTFFPLYAHELGISRAVIGSMFAIRALASTLTRLPGGALATRFTGPRILLVAMTLSMIVAFALPQLDYVVILASLLITEGVAYGLYFTIAQATIAGYADESSRGAALGMYGTVTGIGDSLLPFFLGIVADALGLYSVFYIVGALVALGAGLMARVALPISINTEE
jgi:MFS family permease